MIRQSIIWKSVRIPLHVNIQNKCTLLLYRCRSINCRCSSVLVTVVFVFTVASADAATAVVVVEFLNPFSNIFKDIRLPSFCFIMFHAQINLTISFMEICCFVPVIWYACIRKIANILQVKYSTPNYCGFSIQIWYFSKQFPYYTCMNIYTLSLIEIQKWNKMKLKINSVAFIVISFRYIFFNNNCTCLSLSL